MSKKQDAKVLYPSINAVGRGRIHTMEQLFAHGTIKYLERSVDRQGHAQFHLLSYLNMRTGDRTGWKLTDRDEILKAIKLAKKNNNVQILGGS